MINGNARYRQLETQLASAEKILLSLQPDQNESVSKQDTLVSDRILKIRDILNNVKKELEILSAVQSDIIPQISPDEKELNRTELDTSDSRYRALVDWADDIIFSLDRDGRITAINARTLKSLGIKHSDIIGQEFSTYFSQDEAKFLKKEIDQVLDTGHPVKFERYSANQLGKFWLSINLNPIIDSTGQIVGVSGISRDITERRKVEETLRRSIAQQEALNEIITAAASASSLTSLVQTTLERILETVHVEKGIIWASDRFHVRGFPEKIKDSARELAEKIGQLVDEKFIFSDISLLPDEKLSMIKSFAADFDICSLLYIPFKLDDMGIGGLMLASNKPRQWINDEIAMVEAIGYQVSAVIKRFGLLEKTREQATQVEQLVNTVPEGVVLLDAKGKVILANPAAEKALENLAKVKTGDTLIYLGERPLNDFLTSPPYGLWHEVKSKGRIYEIATKPTEVGPKTSGWVLVLRDVTDEREIRMRTQQQERLAAVGQLAAGIAHDFNNIMAVILLYSQMSIRTPDITSSLRERLTTIEQQSKRATELIQQIMDFSRSTVLDQQSMDLLPFMKELVKLLKRTLPENIAISLEIIPDDYPTLADPTRIQQAVMNLAFNARDAMPDGGKLHFSMEKFTIHQRSKLPFLDMKEGEWIKLEVSDSGAGISAEHISHIFEPFFTTKKAGKGTGLGLAQVYGIVRQHEGYIDVESTLGVGTKFKIYFPTNVEEKILNDKNDGQYWPVGHGETILVVEDNSVTQQALIEGLEALNYQVIGARNGKEALIILDERASGIDLIISDVVMPEMGGKALLNALHEKSLYIKAILMTGHPLSEEGIKLDDKRMVEMLQKPVDLLRLAITIDRVLAE
ncbi:MAG: PAS domain S-box protein [Anaerolineales bacterium]|nr:PAS domain S-box protein [Anaerolineales bacterium]